MAKWVILAIVAKNVFTILFRKSDVVQISYLYRGKTINHQSFSKDCLKNLVCSLKQQRPKCGTKYLKFHHDNARSHVLINLKKFERQKLIEMCYSSYSQDITLSYFLTFRLYLAMSNVFNKVFIQKVKACVNRNSLIKPESQCRKTFNK